MTVRSRHIVEPERKTPILGEYDVVVAGGGPAGVAAATAVARAGRKTILIEKNGYLGGAGTAGGLGTFCGLHANVHGDIKQVVHGIAADLQARIHRLGGLNPPHLSLANKIMAQAYGISAYKAAADDLVLSAGAEILFHTLAVGVVMRSESEIGMLLVESKSGRAAVIGRVFIDGSGDGDLAAWSGAPFEMDDPLGGMSYPTTIFRICGVDPQKAGRAWETIPRLMEEAENKGEYRFPRKGAILRPARNPIEWRANVTQIKSPDGSAVDGTNVRELSYGEAEGRRQIFHTFDFIRRKASGFENAYIVDIAPEMGVRETRRIIGEYRLTEEDVLGCAGFPDTIGVNGWPVEAHVAGDVVIRFPAIPESRGFNQLPFRMIVPQKIENLLVAGRCAPMTHQGHSSARVSGPCCIMGQAAGTAADLALDTNRSCRAIDVGKLQ